MWNDLLQDYVNVIRFDNLGFFTKPYNSTKDRYPINGFCYSFPFINITVNDFSIESQRLPSNIEIIKPKHNDENWAGCFVFLNEFDNRLFNGPMRFRSAARKNIALLNRKEKVWVRNRTHTGEMIFNFHERLEYDNERVYKSVELLDKDYWVKMPVDIALERIRLGKKVHDRIPEWLIEIFLTRDQVSRLEKHPSDYNYYSFKELLKKVF